MKIKIRFFEKKKPETSFYELDELYRDTVLSLSGSTRIQYLENFIGRCKLDLEKTNVKNEVVRIQTLINSANQELNKLKQQP